MIDRTLLVVGWAVVSYIALQTLPVTRLVYHPEQVVISDGEVAVSRSFPTDRLGLPRPRLSYVETVRPVTQSHNGGQSCQEGGGPFRYTRAEDVGVWSIDWASDCLDDPRGFTWSAHWYWHIGAMKVGPVSLTHRVLRDPCRYRVSSSGIIHGPDSPHWSQTSTERCFPTRAAAESATK